jgi:hypothetical protein
MSTVTESFTEAAISGNLSIKPGQSVTYSVSGTFTGKVYLESSASPTVAFIPIAGGVADTGFSGSAVNNTPSTEWFRFRAQGTMTGTAVCSISDVADTLSVVRDLAGTVIETVTEGGRVINGTLLVTGGVTTGAAGITTAELGAKAGSTVTAVENGDGVLHRTTLTLTATPITLTDDPGNGQYGGVKVYDFPAGNILVLGAIVDVDLTLVGAQWTDAAEGDVGLGTAAPSVGTALATTKQNIITTTPIAAMTDQVGAIDCQSVAAGIPLATAAASDADLYLNVRIDDQAAHTTAANNLMTGTVVFTWVNLGDF